MKAISLWKSIRLYVFTSVLLVSLCVAASFTVSINSVVQKNAESSFSDLSDRLAQSADSLFRETELLALTISRNPTLIDIMLRSDGYPLEQQYDDYFKLRAIQTNNSQYPQIDACRFIFRHDAFFVREGDQFLNEDSAFARSLDPELLQADEPRWDVSDGVIRYVQPVFNYLYSPRNIGMVLLEMSRSRLDELFSHIQSLENARFELLFNEHSIAVWEEGTFSEKAPLQRTVPLGSGFTLLFAASGLRHEMTLTQALLTTIPWILFFCTVVFFLFRLIARRLYQTVAQLSSSISSIDLQSGQLVQPTRYTELNNIVEHFNSMLTHIRRKFSDELQARDKERVLSLQMLESQINPHFLYNSLDVINWLAWQEGAEDVAAMARSLGSFYRDALSKTTNENSLRNEMEHVNTYLEIMNHRISDIPRITIDIPEELMNNVLPRLSLQPLLENALQHGILNRKSAPGTILLFVRREKDDLRIAVRDDGPGLSEEKLQKEIADLAQWPPVEMHGLVNIHHRTRLLYGEQYGLSLYSEENQFFEAVLTVPLREFKPSAPFSEPDQ